ncbi:magnesium-translocating P-type ATPase [Gordonia sp. NPDC003376]
MQTESPPWASPPDQLAREFSSGPDGLSADAAHAALPATRARAVSTSHANSAWRLLAHQFTSPIILILVVATLISGLLGDWLDAAIILTIVLLSGLLDFVQERGAQSSMDRLLGTIRLSATCRRDGAEVEVPFDEVVPGDVIVIRAGDIIPADAVVVAATDLQLDQSSLTGETFPATKSPQVLDPGTELADRANMVFAGTHVQSGSGRAMIVATGRDTEFGGVAASLGKKQHPTGFERGMTRFGLLLTRVMVVLVAVIFVVNLVLHRAVIDSALFSLSLAVGLTPQLLPAIVGLSLAQGSKVIARHRVIIKRLNAIEDFGAMTTLCTDKTGTMTLGRIDLSGALDLTGQPDAGLLRVAALNATLQTGLVNAMDAAIVTAATAAGVDLDGARALGEVPYDFVRKRLSVLVDDRAGSAGRPLLVTKGAVEKVFEVCDTARTADGLVPLDDVIASVRDVVAGLGAQGFRVLAVATRESASAAVEMGPASETGLTLVGLLSFADPVKPDAASTVADFADAGVTVRMITGDALPVATHIAGELGLDPRAVMTGRQIDDADDAELARRLPAVRVFCETTPHHKERIVTGLTAAGQIVGYMGDGINDAPALHAADVGISVKGAADVAASSASIVMLEKDLRSLLDGMRAGRRTFANTMKYIQMTTSANFGNMISMAIASLVLPFLPLLAAQILAINLLSDLPAAAIATDRVDDRQVASPQRWDMRLIVNYMVVFGAISSIFDLAAFAVLRLAVGAGESEFQAAWFLASVLTEVFILFILRTRGPAWHSRPSGMLIGLSAGVVAVAFALVLTPAGTILRLSVLPLSLAALMLAIAVAYAAATEIAKPLFWRRNEHRARRAGVESA